MGTVTKADFLRRFYGPAINFFPLYLDLSRNKLACIGGGQAAHASTEQLKMALVEYFFRGTVTKFDVTLSN